MEVASMTIEGLSIDLVNLINRNEPHHFGTATEDAFGRDFTINSMFFNINESKIEDLTGKGFSDLQNGILRTPIEAVKLFT
jgi:tRNA nucleotidyltransferase/poly(A) polymerase